VSRTAWLLAAVCFGDVVGLGQFEAAKTGGIRFGEPQTQRWKAGIIIRAAGAPCTRSTAPRPYPRNGRNRE